MNIVTFSCELRLTQAPKSLSEFKILNAKHHIDASILGKVIQRSPQRLLPHEAQTQRLRRTNAHISLDDVQQKEIRIRYVLLRTSTLCG